MSLIRIEKPDLAETSKDSALRAFIERRSELTPFIEKANNPTYLPWSDLKYKTAPPDFSKQEYWYLIKLHRQINSETTFVTDESGHPYSWVKLNRYERFLNRIDMQAGGNLLLSDDFLARLGDRKANLITRGMLNEAIASSQLEGAHVTREVAKTMILEKRRPRNNSEQMIVNNYETIQRIESEYKNQRLSLDLLLEIHAILAKDTEATGAIGRFRSDKDDIDIGPGTDKTIVAHIPPKEVFLMKELSRLVSVANDDDGAQFTHPFIKAILLHFWIGYLHPFKDGNGRLARALFYWYLLRKGYWAIMYLPISLKIKESYVQYKNAYLLSEQDDYDVTYFIDYNIRQIEIAAGEFQEYLEDKSHENQEINSRLGRDFDLNFRQKHLLFHLGTNPTESTTIFWHLTANRISRLTASRDLNELVEKGLLEVRRDGLTLRFYPSQKAVGYFKA